MQGVKREHKTIVSRLLELKESLVTRISKIGTFLISEADEIRHTMVVNFQSLLSDLAEE